jgi:hypothetical protein
MVGSKRLLADLQDLFRQINRFRIFLGGIELVDPLVQRFDVIRLRMSHPSRQVAQRQHGGGQNENVSENFHAMQ